MPYKAHRDTDSRACGAKTTVVGQSTCKVNNLLWSVDDDPNDHGAGDLDANSTDKVFIENKPVVVHTPDKGKVIDGHLHSKVEVRTSQGSADTFAY